MSLAATLLLLAFSLLSITRPDHEQSKQWPTQFLTLTHAVVTRVTAPRRRACYHDPVACQDHYGAGAAGEREPWR
jgi:hypothetical protein